MPAATSLLLGCATADSCWTTGAQSVPFLRASYRLITVNRLARADHELADLDRLIADSQRQHDRDRRQRDEHALALRQLRQAAKLQSSKSQHQQHSQQQQQQAMSASAMMMDVDDEESDLAGRRGVTGGSAIGHAALSAHAARRPKQPRTNK